VVEAFPEESAPRFLIRDRNQIYGERPQLVARIFVGPLGVAVEALTFGHAQGPVFSRAFNSRRANASKLSGPKASG
jgi:hypothetical protein